MFAVLMGAIAPVLPLYAMSLGPLYHKIFRPPLSYVIRRRESKCFSNTAQELPRPGDSAYERGGDARRKFWIKPLKETDLGMAQACFDPFHMQSPSPGLPCRLPRFCLYPLVDFQCQCLHSMSVPALPALLGQSTRLARIIGLTNWIETSITLEYISPSSPRCIHMTVCLGTEVLHLLIWFQPSSSSVVKYIN